MEKKKTYQKPKIIELGKAKDIIRGLFLGKEVGGADSLFDNDNNPVSVPD